MSWVMTVMRTLFSRLVRRFEFKLENSGVFFLYLSHEQWRLEGREGKSKGCIVSLHMWF